MKKKKKINQLWEEYGDYLKDRSNPYLSYIEWLEMLVNKQRSLEAFDKYQNAF